MEDRRPLVCPVLVGRDDLLALADRRIAEVLAGGGRFLLLAGEAGVGKTRLLGKMERRAGVAGSRTVAVWASTRTGSQTASASVLHSRPSRR